MAKTAVIAFSAQVSGDGLIQPPINLGPYTSANTSGQFAPLRLSVGNNPIGGAASSYFALVPGTANGGATFTWKGVNGDTGITLSSQFPSFIPLGSAASVLNTNVAGNVPIGYF